MKRVRLLSKVLIFTVLLAVLPLGHLFPQNNDGNETNKTGDDGTTNWDFIRPVTHRKTIPDGYDIIDLPPCTMLFFNGARYDNEEDFGIAIDIVFEAVDHYNLELYGWKAYPQIAPRFNFGAEGALGARLAIPVMEK